MTVMLIDALFVITGCNQAGGGKTGGSANNGAIVGVWEVLEMEGLTFPIEIPNTNGGKQHIYWYFTADNKIFIAHKIEGLLAPVANGIFNGLFHTKDEDGSYELQGADKVRVTMNGKTDTYSYVIEGDTAKIPNASNPTIIIKKVSSPTEAEIKAAEVI